MAQRAASGGAGRMNRRFLMVAILLGALAMVLTYVKISHKTGSSSAVSVSGDEQQVVVARGPIKQRTIITADNLEVKKLPAGIITIGAFTNIQDVVGRVTKFPIEPNQQVLSSAVIDTTRPATDAALSLVVPVGKRAVAVPASQVGNAGGLILPGDWVDIVWACCKDVAVVSKTLLRNVQVAAVAQTIVSSGPVAGAKTPDAGTGAGTNAPIAADAGKAVPDASTLTLLLSPDEIQQVFLAESGGRLRATLRGPGDTDTPDSGYTTAFDILPPDALRGLPDALKPDGYKKQ